MKKIYILSLTIILALNLIPKIVRSDALTLPQEESLVETYAPSSPLTRAQKAYLGALEWCESRGKEEAINPRDLDNTPSYGVLEFKPKTYWYFRERYNLNISNDYMDPDGQEAIVTEMIIRNDVKWSQQFPDCSQRLGLPPKLSTK